MVETDVELLENIRPKKDCLTCAHRLPQPCGCGPDAGTGTCGRIHPFEMFVPISPVGAWLKFYRPRISCCAAICCQALPNGAAPHDPVLPDAPDCPGWRASSIEL